MRATVVCTPLLCVTRADCPPVNTMPFRVFPVSFSRPPQCACRAIGAGGVAESWRVTFGLTSYPKCGYLGYMSTQKEKERLELLQGTLDLLILRTLIFGPQHGQGIARAIEQTSEDELLVEHGALYPALQRLEE